MSQLDALRRLQILETKLDEANRRMAALEAAHARCDGQIRELYERNTNLVQLAVASRLLATSIERDDVLSTIEDVVVNMIGSEELAIFDADDGGRSFRIARVRGIDEDSPRLPLARRALVAAVRGGRTFVAGALGADSVVDGLTAAVPLQMEGKVTGAVAIFRLLAQKPRLEPVDFELFEVLSRQGAMALHSASFRSLRSTVRPSRAT
ncbi:MAG TPA: GAF domain-containing protein [Polyangiaceae bacterium]|nr:GAF domain-containing protein [Polyangiaceae bacterium]